MTKNEIKYLSSIIPKDIVIHNILDYLITPKYKIKDKYKNIDQDWSELSCNPKGFASRDIEIIFCYFNIF